MRRLAFAALAAVTAVGIACSSFSSDEPATSPDGGPDGASVPPPSPGDDGSAPLDAATPPFCSTVDASFCWSFDEGTDPLVGKTLQATTPGPSLTDAAASAPYAIEAKPDAGDTQMVFFDDGKTVTHIACELDVFVADVPTNKGSPILGGGAFVARFAVFPPWPMLLAKRDDAGRVTLELSAFNQSALLGNLAANTWEHVRFETTVTDAGYQAAGQIGGASAASVARTDGGTGTIDQLAHIGFGAYARESDWTVRVDNIVCRWE